jgi:uncharacterized membrane protein YkvA (DUF1232 family)
MENEFENFNFLNILKSQVENYQGVHYEIIQKAPLLYDSAVKLLKDVQVTSQFRQKLLAAIGYFIIPNDIYPEDEHGPIGYVEDVMLLIHIFREINNSKGKTPLIRNWSGNEEELSLLLGRDFEILKESFPLLFEEVIKFTGV